MLPPKHRLKGEESFEKVKSKGTLFQSTSFALIVFDRRDIMFPRVGFVVSTKVSKKAVDRNKVKRILRKAFRLKLTEIKQGYDILVLAKKRVLEEDLESLSKELTRILKSASLLK